MQALLRGGELHGAKGPVFQTAATAGIMAAKRTAELIPLCHPIGLDSCDVTVRLNAAGNAEVTCEAAVEHKTGVEMEALTGAAYICLLYVNTVFIETSKAPVPNDKQQDEGLGMKLVTLTICKF